ncbi:hypothetical protein GM3708_2544 [Geminocystis sp. NIES-3708]|uniref:hypothetical protein n=1 Tax=Geminocystis sp. NIES-3708 TaxID=1615909 RepID=UPI0005FCA60B|nr:hypothetical protein [Geminocystis sp. NIES-3708]BAQ62138.1 hypothetical protein GM3708_2544 [Geminocystis sp. NIES-3708]
MGCDRYQDKTVSFIYFGRDQIHIDAKNSFAGLILEDAGLKRPTSQSQDAPYGAFSISLEELRVRQNIQNADWIREIALIP